MKLIVKVHVNDMMCTTIYIPLQGTKSTLDKATLLHALGSLDLEEAHNYVVQLATSTSTHMLLRTAAIYCLMPQRTPVQYRDKVSF